MTGTEEECLTTEHVSTWNKHWSNGKVHNKYCNMF